MIRAVFFDMDGTLLPLDMGEYLPRQFAHLARRVFPSVDLDTVVNAQWHATRSIIHQGDGRHRGIPNSVIYERELSYKLGIPYHDFEQYIDRYFEEDIHAFREEYVPHPQAMEAVQRALDKKLLLVLATNPVFQRRHVRARIKWSKIDLNCFEFYTSMEDSWSAKPHRIYLEECLQRLGGGIKPEECLFVGNDRHQDMQMANRFGMRTFLVNYMPSGNVQTVCWDEEGDMAALIKFIKKLPVEE